MNTALVPERRSDLLLAAMSFEQKTQEVTGALPEVVPELPQCKVARRTIGIPAQRIPQSLQTCLSK